MSSVCPTELIQDKHVRDMLLTIHLSFELSIDFWWIDLGFFSISLATATQI